MIVSRALQLLLITAFTSGTPDLWAQSAPTVIGSQDVSSPRVGVRFSAAEANAPPGTCGCFWLTGGALDVAMPLHGALSAAVEVAGSTVNRVPGTARGLSSITLFAGPRYTVPFGRVSVSAQALFGAARGFDADFITGPHRADTATAFGFAAGGFTRVALTQNVSLRAVQVDYLQTNLPNGVDNRQRNVRVGAGIDLRLTLHSQR